jgi:hypothetical protein
VFERHSLDIGKFGEGQVVENKVAEGHSGEGRDIADGCGGEVEIFDREFGKGGEIGGTALFEGEVAQGKTRERCKVVGDNHFFEESYAKI